MTCMFNVIHINNKYMNNYDKNMSHHIRCIWMQIICVDWQCLNGYKRVKKLPECNSIEFNKSFIKGCNENSNRGHSLEVDVEYPKNLHNLHSDLPFLPERMKIKKCNKLVCNIQDKEKYVVHIRALKLALNHGLILKKVHRVIQFNQKAWLKPYIDMNTKLREEAKKEFEKDFFKLKNNAVFGKTMENVRKHRDIKLVTTNKRRNQLVSAPNYHTLKCFSGNLMAIEIKKKMKL